jgi:hypothetical protein
MDYSNLCYPAVLYFVISVIYLIINIFTNFNILSIIINVILIVSWTLLLQFLCSIGYNIISWVILILPFFITFRLIM